MKIPIIPQLILFIWVASFVAFSQSQAPVPKAGELKENSLETVLSHAIERQNQRLLSTVHRQRMSWL